jgi:hypothetical protein
LANARPSRPPPRRDQLLQPLSADHAGKGFFFEAAHRVTRLPGDAIELDISVYPFDKVGNFAYPPRQSSEFSAADIAHIRDLIANYLKTNREALHPIFAPAEQVRSVRVRLP